MSGPIEVTVSGMKERKRRSALADFSIRLFREKPLGIVGAVITLLLLFAGIFAEFVAPDGMNEPHPSDYLAQPSAEHPLGADNLGRDMLSRVIYGARISLLVGVTAAFLSVFFSGVIGVTCGFLGSKFDIVVQRFVDAWMCFPGIIILIVLASVLGRGMWQLVIAMGLIWGITNSRLPRSAVVAIKENVYMDAAGAIGCSNLRIILRHVVPNIFPVIIVMFTVQVPELILAEASLSFLGLGIPPPAPSWGGMLSGSAMNYMERAWWMAVFPGLALAVAVYGINVFGDAIRDLLDPKLRGGVGRYGGVKVSKLKQRRWHNVKKAV